MNKQEETRVRVCHQHKDIAKETFDESWKWNPVYMLPPDKCQIDGCPNRAYWLSIGLRFPDAVGHLDIEDGASRVNCEIFQEAREILRRGESLSALTEYLYSRTGRTSRHKLFNKFASLILKDLGIKDTIVLSDAQKHRILDYLELYPDEI